MTFNKRELAVYVAGPMYSSGMLDQNIRTAIEAAAQLEAYVGNVVLRAFVPHEGLFARQLVAPRTHEGAQAWDDFWLRRCDFLLRLPGVSTGSDHEVELAKRCGLQVFYSVEELLEKIEW